MNQAQNDDATRDGPRRLSKKRKANAVEIEQPISIPTTHSSYQKAIIVICWWESNDVQASLDAQNLQEVLSNQFHFRTALCSLPDDNAEDVLWNVVQDMLAICDEHSLFLFYYAGHSYPDETSQRVIFASKYVYKTLNHCHYLT
jgi:hypothetical protein